MTLEENVVKNDSYYLNEIEDRMKSFFDILNEISEKGYIAEIEVLDVSKEDKVLPVLYVLKTGNKFKVKLRNLVYFEKRIIV